MAGALLPSGDDEGGYKPIAEINITPMVDVMLVLLIIFMVAAPLMSMGVPVDLPRTQAAEAQPPKDPVVVSIDQTGALFLRDQPLAEADMDARLAALAKEKPGSVVYVRGHKDLPYGRVMEVMGRIGQAGFAKVSLMAEMPTPPAAATGTGR
ncbi:protein TolR [Rhodospirillum rubrum]|uniref:protein TolR n=1 Tax=Rhodospirillum rubrum TaxID=1085 RepID=UPI00190873F1|nr:protein TolR [Rhodospirillum rubrum]MBK1664143.1 protein TolR [Rhodospirillum rubrum]MBK1675618.1 protein TolR [Rhodospirillum rubrum]